MGSSPKNDWGILVHENLILSQSCVLVAQKANHDDCIKRGVDSRLIEVILSLCSGKIPLGALCSALVLQEQERHEAFKICLEEVQENGQGPRASLL